MATKSVKGKDRFTFEQLQEVERDAETRVLKSIERTKRQHPGNGTSNAAAKNPYDAPAYPHDVYRDSALAKAHRAAFGIAALARLLEHDEALRADREDCDGKPALCAPLSNLTRCELFAALGTCVDVLHDGLERLGDKARATATSEVSSTIRAPHAAA